MNRIKLSTNIFRLILFVSAVTITSLFFINMYRESTDHNRRYNIILIPKVTGSGSGFWASLIEGARIGATEFNVELEVLGVFSEDDIAGQNQKILEAIERKPDVILLAPLSTTETIPYIEQAIEAGIPVVLVDSVVDKEIGSGVVSTDNISAGREMGEYAKRFLSEDSQVGIIGHGEGASTAIERAYGIRTGLGEYVKNIQEELYGGFSHDKAYDLTRRMLNENSNIDVILATNEYSSIGAARAIQDLNLQEQVMLIGFDNSLEQIQLLEKGVFQAIVIQKPVNMGYLAVELAVRVAQDRSENESIDSGNVLIDRDNMHLRENQQLLFPFTSQP